MTINPLTSKQEDITIICDSTLCGGEKREKSEERRGEEKVEERRRGGEEEEEEKRRRRRVHGNCDTHTHLPTWVSPATSSAAH